MELDEFAGQVPGFAKLDHPAKILHSGWYLIFHRGQVCFSQADLRVCYKALHMEPPNLSLTMSGLVAKRPRVVLEEKGGYKLEHTQYTALTEKYGEHETTIAMSQLLRALPGKLSDDAEKLFLSEAIKCYHHKAFRAAIVMAWNLAYDHLLRWILADPARLAAFSASIAGRVGANKAAKINIVKREDFEELKEAEVLDICGTAKLFKSSNTKKILDMQLTKRNMAAHPSLVSIDAPQADDPISSLVNNVVLILV